MEPQYQVVMGTHGLNEFQQQVENLMAMGFRPVGGVCVTQSTDVVPGAITIVFYQAMGRGL